MFKYENKILEEEYLLILVVMCYYSKKNINNIIKNYILVF